MDNIATALSWVSLIVGLLLMLISGIIITLHDIFAFQIPPQFASALIFFLLMGTAAFVVGSVGKVTYWLSSN